MRKHISVQVYVHRQRYLVAVLFVHCLLLHPSSRTGYIISLLSPLTRPSFTTVCVEVTEVYCPLLLPPPPFLISASVVYVAMSVATLPKL